MGSGYFASNRWLTKNEYSRIRYRAKKMGATQVDLSAIWHKVYFRNICVYFAFKPLAIKVSVISNCDIEDAEQFKRDVDKAFEFGNFLKEFEKTIEK